MTAHGLARTLTNFGNLAVAGPLAALITVWLWTAGQRRLAQIVTINAVCAVAATVVLKEVSRTLGGTFFGTPLYLSTGAPSGHVVISLVSYGALGVLFAVGSRGALRVTVVALASLLVAAVAVTRVTLHAHTPADVAAGLIVGGVFTGLTALAARRNPDRWPAMTSLLITAVVLLLVLQVSGLRFNSTQLM